MTSNRVAQRSRPPASRPAATPGKQQQPETRYFWLPAADGLPWQDELPDGFRVDADPVRAQDYVLLDSFGGLLHQAQRLLLCDGEGCYRLLGPEDHEIGNERSDDSLRFWWDFATPTLRTMLKGSLGFWSLMPQAQFSIRQQHIALRNAEDKIVARISLRQLHGPDAAVPQALALSELRGYSGEFHQISRHLKNRGATQEDALDLLSMLKRQRLSPEIIPAKLRYRINPQQEAETAVRQMALQTSSHARRYEDGIIADTDTEFLHQFRVNLRRARSLISLMKGVFDNDTYVDLKTRLATIAGSTGELRDLDVFLLERDRYAAMLPPGFETGFIALFEAITRERSEAQARLAQHLRSTRHQNAFEQLEKRLQQPPQRSTRSAKMPIARLARRKTLNRYLKIIRLGTAIDAQTPDEQVHDLRIECKKLRYLLEFFSELFGRSRTRHLIDDLKGLQDILGQFNDYAVQQDFLRHYGEHGNPCPDQIRTVGGLTAVLHRQQIEAREQVQDAFARFASASVAQDFHALLD